jgi:D-alanyl-D-alanine dipeptidase
MGTAFDCFDTRSYLASSAITPEQRAEMKAGVRA